MSLDKNDIRYDVDIDLRDSLQEIEKLRQKLGSFSSDLAVDATKVQRTMAKAASDYVQYIRKLEGELKSLKAQGHDTTAHEARLSQIRSRQRAATTGAARDYAQGSDRSIAARSVLQREVNELRSSTQELVGRYFDEINQSYLRNVRRSLTSLHNEEALLRNRMEERGYRAQHGDAAYGFMKQRERRTLNGGANQFLSQAGILSNYAMVGGAYGATFALGRFITDLDAEFKQFQAITNSTNTEMKLMEDRLLSVSEKTKFTANEIAQAATLMGQAGMSVREVGEAIEPISMLATAAGTDLKNAVDVVTSALNIFNLQTGEAGHLANVFTAALNESKLTLEQITAALQYSGNTAATVGISYTELTAAVGAMANAGIRSGSTIGTGMRQLLVDLITPSKNLKAELARLGLSLEDIDVRTHGLTGVLQNLKSAGFNTASAFEGLEVRAAAAFTALSNNFDNISELHQSLVLTSAATEANEIQMKSLANTAKNFGSNIGALSYTAFKPFLGTLQNSIEMASSTTAALRELGPVVEVVGTAFATLTSALILARLGRLAGGLIGISVAATGTAGALNLLRAATIGNPLFFGAMVLITGLQLLAQYADKAGRVRAELDQLKTEQNEYQASVNHTNDRIASLTAAMDDLVRKQKTLDEGSEVLRKTKIMEVLSSFTELTGEIDASTASVADLIDAMRNLKTEMAGGLPEQFGLLVDKIDQRIEILKKAADESARSSAGELSHAATNVFDFKPLYILREHLSDAANNNDRITDRFGDNIGQAYQIATRQIDLDKVGGQRAQSLLSSIERKLLDKNLDGANRKFIEELRGAFAPIAKYLVDINAEQLDRGIQVGKQAQATLQNTAGYRQADELRTETTGWLSDRLKGVLKQDLPVEELKKTYDELEIELSNRIRQINDGLKAAADEMRQSGQFSAEEIQQAVGGSELQTAIANFQGDFKKDANTSAKAFKKLQLYLNEQNQKAVEKQINATKKELADAQNERQVDLLENQLYSLDKKLADLELEAFDINPDKDIGGNDADLQLAKRKIQDDQKSRRSDLISNVIEKRAEMAEKANGVYEDDLKAQLKRVENEMKDLAGSINNNSTPDFIRTIKEKLDELNRKARELAGQIAGISVSSDYGAFSVGGLPTATAGDIHRQIIEAANKAGIPAEIALAIASFESGFNPNAKNPNSSAAGLYQNTDANWSSHGLSPADRSSAEMQIFAGIQDMLRTQKELGTTQLSFKDYYGAHLLGQGGYKKVYQNPNSNAVALLGSDVVLNNGGNASQSASEFLDAIVRKASAHLDKVKGFVQRPMDAAASALETETDNLTEGARAAVRNAGERAQKAQIKQAVRLADEQAKAIEAQINTLMVSSSKVQDPSALRSIIDQVREKWSELAKKEIEAFTAANEGTDDFDIRLASLTEELNAGLGGKIVTLLDRYQQSIENLQFEPLLDAQAKLQAAQNPLNAHKFTENQVQGLQRNVHLQERAALQERLNQLDQLSIYITQQIAAAEQQYGTNSQIVQALKERQYSVEQSLNGVRQQAKADTEAIAKSEISLKQAIESTNQAWLIRNGIKDAQGNLVSTAVQVGQAWSQMLDGISSSMTTLFTDLASGSMTAEEAFKKFGLSVIQMLMQMIAKALVFNMLQGLMGGTGGSAGGGSGGFLGMLFGVGGAATGQYISGVKRAAGGEYITGNAPFRDSELRMVEPGEMILRTSAVNQIGRDALEKINALGNRRIAAGMPTLPAAQPVDQRPINVWAVLPEEMQQIGPDDVVAYISDDIRRRGVTRQLIKAVSADKL